MKMNVLRCIKLKIKIFWSFVFLKFKKLELANTIF